MQYLSHLASHQSFGEWSVFLDVGCQGTAFNVLEYDDEIALDGDSVCLSPTYVLDDVGMSQFPQQVDLFLQSLQLF